MNSSRILTVLPALPRCYAHNLLWLAGAAMLLRSVGVSATPLDGSMLPRQSPPNGQPPPDSGNSNSSNDNTMSSKEWIPILVVAVILALLIMVFCARRYFDRRSSVAITSTTAGGTASDGPQPAPYLQPRRRRRPRRTPSQISTKSLPAYMKEPGEQELVIIRGPSEIEDDVTNMMPVMEENEEPSEMTMVHHDIPLDRIDSHDTLPEASSTDLMHSAPQEMFTRPSMDGGSLSTSHSQESTSSLLEPHHRMSSDDPRGEAPPYFETVDGDVHQSHGVVNLNEAPAVTVSVAPVAQSTNTGAFDRRSRLSNFFSSFHPGSRAPPVPQGRSPTPSSIHTRDFSSSSATGRPSHNPSHSGSGSISALSSSALRSLRANGNNNAMTSPSTISLDSISAPLTHTLTRSEFRAPKGGLTPEQIKLITSRDALERFGRPYGPDAVAFSASQLSMAAPPPDFDSSQSQTNTTSNHRSGLSVDSMAERRAGSPVSVLEVAGSSRASSSSPERILANHSRAGSTQMSSPSIPAGLYPPSAYQPPRAASRASTVMTFATAAESVSSDPDNPTTPVTARPLTPPTARPLA